jgi:hypothetical protein
MNTGEMVAALRQDAEHDRQSPYAAKIVALCDAFVLMEGQRDKATETVENIQGKVAMYAGKYAMEAKAREKAKAEILRLREENENLREALRRAKA